VKTIEGSESINRRTFLIGAGAAAAAGAATLTGLANEPRPSNGGVSDAFLKQLPQLMDWANVPGLAFATLKDGRPERSHAFGVRKAGESAPVTTATLFGAASLSKPVVAYALLRMRDEKLIDLDRPLWEYLPYEDLPPGDQARQITARHALSHSSGLQNWRFNRDNKLEFAFKPGERFQYSGEGIYYLSRVIERIANRGFEEYMQERVFKPLGMASSTYGWTTAAESKMTWGHNGRAIPQESFNAQRGRQMLATAEQWKKPLPTWRHEDVARAYSETNKDAPVFPNFLLPNAAGSLLSTADEYALFMSRLLKPRGDALDLSEASRREMLAPTPKINGAISWGLGVGLESFNGRQYFWHWGDNGVFKAFMMGEPASGSGVVIFTNAQNGHRMWQRIVAETMGRDHPSTYFYMT
jgi:CubicO group peptidase (beta-lactamase class C family)